MKKIKKPWTREQKLILAGVIIAAAQIFEIKIIFDVSNELNVQKAEIKKLRAEVVEARRMEVSDENSSIILETGD